MGNKKGNGLDQFYTNIDVAKLCVDTIDISKYDIVVEPSAGTGAFYNIIDHPNKVGIDLEPKCEGVEKQDFLNWDGDIFKDFNILIEFFLKFSGFVFVPTMNLDVFISLFSIEITKE